MNLNFLILTIFISETKAVPLRNRENIRTDCNTTQPCSDGLCCSQTGICVEFCGEDNESNFKNVSIIKKKRYTADFIQRDECHPKLARLTVNYKMKSFLNETLKIKFGLFELTVRDGCISLMLEQNNQLLKNTNHCIFNSTESLLWVSYYALDNNTIKNNFIKVGIGYMYENNTIFEYRPSNKAILKLMRDINDIDINVPAEKFCYDYAVIKDYEPVIKNSIDFEDLNGNFVTEYHLPKEAQKLYRIINSEKLELTEDEVSAINYSLDHKRCILNDILVNKTRNNPFNSDRRNEMYIRVTFKFNDGSAPGQPYVLEIWPKGNCSPIHDHGNSIALIKVFHGTLKSEWFNPLSENVSLNEPIPIKSTYFNKGDVAWMTPDYYQTHRLTNENLSTAAITLQMYAHESSQKTHLEFFSFLKGTKIKEFWPNSDVFFDEMRERVLSEYYNRKC